MAETPLGITNLVSLDDFKKIELRVAKIISVEDHPNASKLYKLTIDLGSEQRTLVAGVKPFYAKEELFGKQVIVVVNLQPVIIRGVESKGMLLATKAGNSFVLLSPDKPADVGARIE